MGSGSCLWVEKYRPRDIDSLFVPDDYKQKFDQYIAKKEIPHLMFVGDPGVGKTTVARILISHLNADCMELNASVDRGINVLRERVMMFLGTKPIYGKDCKILFLDEADKLTPDFQDALRNPMEKFHSNVRIIFSLNYGNKMAEAIASRCQVFQFKAIPIKEIVKLFKDILDKEGVKYDIDDLLALAEDCRGDLRKGVGTLERDSTSGTFKYCGNADFFVDISALLGLARKRKWADLAQEVKKLDDFVSVYTGLFEEFYGKHDKATAIVGEYMYRDSIVFSSVRVQNLLVCFSELIRLT